MTFRFPKMRGATARRSQPRLRRYLPPNPLQRLAGWLLAAVILWIVGNFWGRST